MAKTTKPETAEDAPAEDAPAEDLNAATITLEYGGQKFEIPKRRGRWPIEAILQFGRGQTMQAIHALFGRKDWERLKTVCPTGDDWDQFLETVVDVLNTEAVF